jgi:hypothetical protein
MKEFIVKTNFGHTYRWSPERIAEDYADTAIQWQDEDDIAEPQTHEQLKHKIINDEHHLTQWFNDYIRGDVEYAVSQAELVSVDQAEYQSFIDGCIRVHGREV